ncbi:MAG: GIY-YIG nuclease family protein [Burkholderiaceae bacterium]
MSIPFSLRIFVADGDPDGLRIVEKSNWIGKALVFPRALLPQVKARPELAQTGVYLLLGPRPDGEGELLYVGEGDPILPRLQDHQSKKDFWTRAIGFTTATAGLLNKAHVQFLEARLIALARAAKRVPLDNANQPTEPSLSEADRADMEVFLAHMLGMLPVRGCMRSSRPQPWPCRPPCRDSQPRPHQVEGRAGANAEGVAGGGTWLILLRYTVIPGLCLENYHYGKFPDRFRVQWRSTTGRPRQDRC